MAQDQDDPSDRRRAERIPINVEFAAMSTATYISDLSEYGVFVHTETPSAPGAKLKLRFTVLLDDPVIVEAEGRVVRRQTDPGGMGIEFTELSPEMILRINDVVSRQRPRDSGPPLAREDGSEDAAEAKSAPDAAGDDDPGAVEVDAIASQAFSPPPRLAPDDVENLKTGRYPSIHPLDDDAE